MFPPNLLISLCVGFIASAKGTEFRISFPTSEIARSVASEAKLKLLNDDRLTGRVRLYLTRDNSTAPYESSSDDQSSGQVVFGSMLSCPP